MECPKCQHQNRPGLRFCSECGEVLKTACPACGFELEAGEKYCGECGHDLSTPVTPTKSTPQPEPVRSSAPEGERRQATVLFSDLSGYTAMNERLDPEEVQGLMRRLKDRAVEIVETHGGIVSQFVGDEMLALFGIPRAHEDDPVRAVRAARGLHELARDLSSEVEEKIGRPFRMHTGIDSGLVVTSTADTRDGTVGVTGDTVNTGARLKALAADDAILVSPETQRLVGDFFETEVLEALELKGKAEAMVPYRVTGERGIATRFEAAAVARGLTPLAGRTEELATLHWALQKALEGEGQFVTVIGEPGVGKSRLAYEFHQSMDIITVLEGRCRSYGAETPYLPFLDALRRSLQLREENSAAELEEKAVTNIRAIDPALERYLPHLLHLLSIPSESHKLSETLQGDALRRELEEALVAAFTHSTRHGPMVVLFEDWHWADEASDSALKNLIGLLSGYPLMLVVLYRPEYTRAWGKIEHYTAIVLKALDVAHTEAMLRSVFRVERLPDGLGGHVHARTGGNALFNEEVARSLVEERIVAVEGGAATLSRPLDELRLPATVHGVIRARVDRLAPDDRELLRLASVIGREFDRPVLERIADSSAQVSAALERLARQDLVHQVRVVPEAEYLFKHVLTQEVVYETLLLSQRKELHAAVGAAIEALYPDRLEEHYEGLAHHFDLGNVWDKAVEFYIRAGIKARKKFAVDSASDHFDHAERIVTEQAPEVNWRVMYDLYMEKAQTLGDRGQWRFAYETVQSAVLIAEREGAQHLQIQAMVAQCMAALFSYQFRELEHIIERLEPWVANDLGALVRVVSFQCAAYAISGDLQGALASENRMDDLFARKSAVPFFGMFFYAYGLYKRWRGEFDKSMEIIGPALPRTKESAPLQLYLQMVFHYGLALGELGRFEEAITVLKEGVLFGNNAGERFATPKVVNSLAWAFHELCLFDKAIETNNEAMASIQVLLGPGTTNLFDIESHIRINLGENYLAIGKNDLALENLNLVYENARLPDYFFARNRWKPRCLLTLGEVWFEMGDLAKAQSYLDEVVELGWVHKFPYRKYQVRFWRLQGRIIAAQGKFQAAEAELKRALTLAEQLGNPTQVWRTYQALGTVYSMQEKAKEAEFQHRAALETVQGIAERLTDPELREGFLQSNPIREIFAQFKGV